MALPEPFYRDPAQLMERVDRPSLAGTCFRCASSQLEQGEYRCVLGMAGFPLLGKDKCKWWGPKNERRRNR